jgi:hypothetical protein
MRLRKSGRAESIVSRRVIGRMMVTEDAPHYHLLKGVSALSRMVRMQVRHCARSSFQKRVAIYKPARSFPGMLLAMSRLYVERRSFALF